jgi:hypothetical protein
MAPKYSVPQLALPHCSMQVSAGRQVQEPQQSVIAKCDNSRFEVGNLMGATNVPVQRDVDIRHSKGQKSQKPSIFC